MRQYAKSMGVIGTLFGFLSCNGDSPNVPPPPTTTTTIATQPSPSPSPSASPVSTQCTLPPGPVTRLAIAPRALRTGSDDADILVRARPDWDEVICLDKDKTHRLDFNANQRNADGRESCYDGAVTWRVDDSSGMVTGNSSRHDDGFIWRFNVDPGGRSGAFEVEAELDGIRSYPWQSGSGYRQEPLRVLAMSANDIARDCQCIFKGNGVYEGDRCPK